MSLWNYPRLTAALCTVAVLGCAAAPAVFLAAADAASLGRVETVADPYVAPTPTADDYYILRQLAARSRTAERAREPRPAEDLPAPKILSVIPQIYKISSHAYTLYFIFSKIWHKGTEIQPSRCLNGLKSLILHL